MNFQKLSKKNELCYYVDVMNNVPLMFERMSRMELSPADIKVFIEYVIPKMLKILSCPVVVDVKKVESKENALAPKIRSSNLVQWISLKKEVQFNELDINYWLRAMFLGYSTSPMRVNVRYCNMSHRHLLCEYNFMSTVSQS